MQSIRNLRRLALAPVFAGLILSATPGLASATTGYEGVHHSNGAKCWLTQIEVNAPEVFAFDATTAVDYQNVYWTTELWELDTATNSWKLDIPYGEWSLLQVSDGTDGTSIFTIGGGQTFNINRAGTYTTAIRYSWEATASAPAGEAFEWVGPHYTTGIGSLFGTGPATVESCTF